MNQVVLVFFLVALSLVLGAPPGLESSDSETEISIKDSNLKTESPPPNELNESTVVKDEEIITTTTTTAIKEPEVTSNPENNSLENVNPALVGRATSRLAGAILAGYSERPSNVALSPLGYSTLLALVAEGARGDTQKQIISALGLEETEPEPTRQAFRSVLKSLKRKNSVNHPEFKNWFYVSKKYSVNQDFIRLLREYYLTEVKIIRDWLNDEDETLKEPITPTKTEVNKNEQIKEETIKENIKAQTALDQVILEEYIEQQNKVQETSQENQNEKTTNKEEKKDEKINETPSKESNEKKEEIENEKNEKESPKVDNENKQPLLDLMAQYALREKNNRASKELLEKVGGSSGLSGNKFASKLTTPGSIMLAFNGLYFKGRWPAKAVRPVQGRLPFKAGLNGTKTVDVQMLEYVPLQKNGARFNRIPELKSKAYEIPYEGGRFALLLLVPDEADGLCDLLNGLPNQKLLQIQSGLEPLQKYIVFPRFEIETTTQPRKSLDMLGIKNAFSTIDADLSGISAQQGLYVHDLAQFVAVKVDALSSSTNLITAEGFAVARAEEEFTESQKEMIDRPFAFFILDRENGVVIVAGRVVDPTQMPPPFISSKI